MNPCENSAENAAENGRRRPTTGRARAGTMESVAHRARFAAVMTAITRRLPFGLSEVVAPSLVGYLLINLCTFFVDLGLLGLLPRHVAVADPGRRDAVLRDRLRAQLRAQPGAELPQPRRRRQAVPGLRGGQREQLPDLRPRPHRPAVRRRRVLRVLPGHRGLLRGRLPVLHAALGGVPRQPRRRDGAGAEAGGRPRWPRPIGAGSGAGAGAASAAPDRGPPSERGATFSRQSRRGR